MEVLLVATFVLLSSLSADGTPSQSLVTYWAEKIGKKIRKFSSDCTGFEEVKKRYENLDLEVEMVIGETLASALSQQLETFFDGKVKALQNLAKEAAEVEKVFKDDERGYSYFNGKYLHGMNLTYAPNFGVPVNFNASIVHIPTEVYDGDPLVARDIKWTKRLNKIFQNNFKKYQGLSWQYFGSAEGIHRQYPGRRWPLPPVGKPDLYDARRRPWYIQGASSPKDVVILIDRSGSMLGVPIKIAKTAARVIIDTLTTNDFFHVVVFNDKSKLICCHGEGETESNVTLMQATREHKEYVKSYLHGIKAESTADWNAGVTTALKLLQYNKLQNTGSQCQQVLIVLSDGSANYEKEAFQKYDPESQIRVFTYVVGTPHYGVDEMKEMSCKHDGYFLRIRSMGAVWDIITSYIRVLSRSIGQLEETPATFTSVFVDATGTGLVSTGSVPVFKKSNKELLGVMATDVPVKDLSEFILFPLIGHNGYIFVIDNNGLVLIHPGINGDKLKKLDPQPNMDLAELEYAVSNQSLAHQMRNHMITSKDGSTHSISFEAFVKSSDELQVRQDLMNYYYMRSKSSPFSIGIASPKYGFLIKKPFISYEKGLKYLADVSRIKRWPYCTNVRRFNDLKEKIMKKLVQAARKKMEPENCELSMIQGLLIDSYVTSNLPKIWKSKVDIMKLNDVIDVHVRTHWGVIRTYNGSLPRSEKISELKEEDLSVAPWDFYSRVVRLPYDLTISMSLLSKENRERKHVSIYQPVRLEKQKITTAVTGIDMKYETFTEKYFVAVTKECPINEPLCDGRITCDRTKRNQVEGRYCYLLDENAFVISSNEPGDAGMFFGSVDSKLMAKFLEVNKTYSLYDTVILPDYQASCKLCTHGEHSSGNRLITPFQVLSASAVAFMKVIFSLLFKMALATVHLQIWDHRVLGSEAKDCIFVSCIKNSTFYLMKHRDGKKVEFQGSATCGTTDPCVRKFTVSNIPGSNLILIVVDSNCGRCKQVDRKDLPGIPGQTEEIMFTNTDYVRDSDYERQRRNPSKCYKKQNKKTLIHCGGGCVMTQSTLSLISCWLVITYL